MKQPLTGLFVGAGFSLAAGMPLVWELTTEFKNWLTGAKLRHLSDLWRAMGTGPSEAVIEDFVAVLERPDLHYEALLGYVETQQRRQHSLSQEYHGFYSWLVEYIYMLLFYRQVNNDAFFAHQLAEYDGLCGLATENAPLWIFSLNHDLIVEMICARLGLPLYCGFSPNTITLPRRNRQGEKIGDIRAEVLTGDELEHAAMCFPNPPESGVYLHKIHGSLDVFTFNDGKDLLRLLPESQDAKAISNVLRAANEDLIYVLPTAPGGVAKATNEIVYADDSGTMQFLRRTLLAGAHKFDGQRSQVLPESMLKHFQGNLNFITTLVCIGYGFGDIHINEVLARWLEFSASRRLEIVSPQAKDVPSFLLHVAPQVSIMQSTCVEYLDSKGGVTRSRVDVLRRRIAAVSRRMGVSQSRAMMQAFAVKEQERAAKTALAKLKTHSENEGTVGTDAIRDPTALAHEWASEFDPNREETLARLLTHLEASGDDGTG